MLQSYQRFIKLVKDTENVEVLYNYFEKSITVSVDISDLLRWQWVQCISAFDKFIHESCVCITPIFLRQIPPSLSLTFPPISMMYS